VLIDTMLYPAAAITQEETFPLMAPSMDLAVRFHGSISDSEFLLASTETPVATEGILGGYAAVWSEEGQLLATGGQQMIVKSFVPTA
jgi:acyl-CoA thioesterase